MYLYNAKVFIAKDECIYHWWRTCLVLEMNTLALDTNTFTCTCSAKDESLSILLFSPSSLEHFIVVASYQRLPNKPYVEVVATYRYSIVDMTASHNIQVLCEKPKKCLKETVLHFGDSFEVGARQS